MNFSTDDFRIVYGAIQEEIEAQVKTLQEQGYVVHGTLVAQPNAHVKSESSLSQTPFYYDQMLAKQKQPPSQQKARSTNQSGPME